MPLKQALSYLGVNRIGGLSVYITQTSLMDDLLKYQSFILLNSRMPFSIDEFDAFGV
jgi:hypothetical protein